MSVCLVTAFYGMPSKHPVKQYLDWMEPFFTDVPCNMVIFTEPQFVGKFLEWRRAHPEKTIVITLPPSEFGAEKWGAGFWEEQQNLDHEKSHSPELYKIWYEKKEFVMRAIGMRAFSAEKFVWCDAGILRFPDWLARIQAFPDGAKISDGKMVLLNIAPFEAGETSSTNFQHVNRIGGGIQAADRETWKWWSAAYDAMMEQFIRAGKFCGKDQSIMASVVLENPERVVLVRPPEEMHPIMKWFLLLLVLS
jgi:hypothetical protein